MGRSIVTVSMPVRVWVLIVIHKALGLRADGESVEEVMNVQDIRSGDGNGG